MRAAGLKAAFSPRGRICLEITELLLHAESADVTHYDIKRRFKSTFELSSSHTSKGSLSLSSIMLLLWLVGFVWTGFTVWTGLTGPSELQVFYNKTSAQTDSLEERKSSQSCLNGVPLVVCAFRNDSLQADLPTTFMHLWCPVSNLCYKIISRSFSDMRGHSCDFFPMGGSLFWLFQHHMNALFVFAWTRTRDSAHWVDFLLWSCIASTLSDFQ